MNICWMIIFFGSNINVIVLRKGIKIGIKIILFIIGFMFFCFGYIFVIKFLICFISKNKEKGSYIKVYNNCS